MWTRKESQFLLLQLLLILPFWPRYEPNPFCFAPIIFSQLNVMDYSLIVGIDENDNELVVGIIGTAVQRTVHISSVILDYLRWYTWDKQLESWVKSYVMGGKENSTVVSPAQYQTRFCEAIWQYFCSLPTVYSQCKEIGMNVNELGLLKPALVQAAVDIQP